MNIIQITTKGSSPGTAVPRPAHAVSGRRCPICTSYETQRHVEGFRVWFTCNCCGAVFH